MHLEQEVGVGLTSSGLTRGKKKRTNEQTKQNHWPLQYLVCRIPLTQYSLLVDMLI